MTDDTVICPECTSDQPADAPFCEQCGFRLRAAETVREVLGPEERSRLDRLLKRDSESGPDDTIVRSRPTSRPSRKLMSLSEETEVQTEEEAPAIHLGPERNVKPSNTLVEGVPAIEPRTMALDAVAFQQPPETSEASAAEVSGDSPAPQAATASPGRTSSHAIVWATVTLCIAAMALLSWIHVEQTRDHGDNPVSLSAPSIIEIEAGSFRRGLSREAQSYIMQICHRIQDDAAERCDRDNLLPGEFPQQTVRMPAFSIDSGPVRNVDYQACVADGGCSPQDLDDCQIWTPQGRQIGVRMPQALLRDDRPVVCVTRDQARSFCRHRGGDLPTHNQWEKAARGPDGYLFPWGEFWSADFANWGERDVMQTVVAGKLDGHAWTSPPGSYPDGQSPYGLDDMAGNVAEWVRGDDDIEGHVRGGSWISTPFELRTTAREPRDARQGRTDIGFRCVYDP